MRVVIVDDEPFAIHMLAHQLTSLGVEEIASFEEAGLAIDQAESGILSADIVFCDLQMPGMDGIELIRNLAELNYRKELVLISGEDRGTLQAAANAARAHALNLSGVLEKPITSAALAELLRSAGHDRSDAPARTPRREYDAADLRAAIGQDELFNHYQLKVAASDGRVVGLEALARWQHRADGIVYPDQFIPLAERSGLSDGIDRRIFSNACADLSLWRADPPLHVAVNVSMESLTDYSMPERISTILTEHNLSTSRVCIEVTETRPAHDERFPMDVLARLRLKGFDLSLDDFGTGHSSLSRLRDLPFVELKFDRSFIHGASRSDETRVIVQSTLTMAKQLGLKTVAEGVEDREDWDFVRNSGIDVVQGYFVARPVPAQRVADRITDWTRRVQGEGLVTGPVG